MEFLAGIIVAWAVVYAIICVTMLLAYASFGRNQEYLTFAVVCGFLVPYSVARAAETLASDADSVVGPSRVVMAVLPLASTALLQLGLGRWELAPSRRRWLRRVSMGVAAGLAALALAGWGFDYGQVLDRTFPLWWGEVRLIDFAMTPFGVAVSGYSLLCAIGGCVLLLRSVRADRLVRSFFLIAIALLLLLGLNDLLLAAALIRSVYGVEHGLLFMVLVVLTGFLREFERSRQELRVQTEQLQQANTRLERLAADLSESTEQLDRAADETRRLRPMADLGRLSASLAHEIRNPLAVLSNVAASLRRHAAGAEGDQVVSLVGMLQEETDRLARLVDDLLLFSRTGRFSQHPVDLAAVIEHAAGEVERLEAVAGGCRIEVEIQDSFGPITGSMDSLGRALENLILNAVQSSKGKGCVRLTAQLDPERAHWVSINVRDEAGGVPPELVRDVFEPFFSTRPTGTGLGLPIVKAIVEAHGGALELHNDPGHGAAFVVRLPTREALVAEAQAAVVERRAS